MKLTLLICLVLLSTLVLSVPVKIDRNIEVESMPESDDVTFSEDNLSRKFKGPFKLKKCAKPDQTIEYYQKWCSPSTSTTTSTTTTTTTATTPTTTSSTATTTMGG